MEEWQYLGSLENHSLYIRNLIQKDRLERIDHNFIVQKKAELNAEIKKLDELLKVKNVDQGKIPEILSYHAPSFKQNSATRSEIQRIRFIEKMIQPQLKKYGSKSTAAEIDQLLLNWPEE